MGNPNCYFMIIAVTFFFSSQSPRGTVNWRNIWATNIFFFKKILCHSFRITVIPSGLLSFLPDYCHSFQIIVIPSRLVSFLPNIVIPSELLPFQIFVTLNSSGTLPYPKGEKNGPQRWPYMRVFIKIGLQFFSRFFSCCHWFPNILLTQNFLPRGMYTNVALIGQPGNNNFMLAFG